MQLIVVVSRLLELLMELLLLMLLLLLELLLLDQKQLMVIGDIGIG